jgi:hypothetical protein
MPAEPQRPSPTPGAAAARPSGRAPGAATAQPPCADRVDALRREFARAQPNLPYISSVVPAVTYAPQRIERGEPWLTITNEIWLYNREPVEPAEMGSVLREAAELWAEQGEETTPVYLAAAPDVDITTLAKVVAMLPESFSPRLVVQRAETSEEEIPRFARPWWRSWRSRPESERARELSNALERWMGTSCEPLHEAVREVAESGSTRWMVGQELYPEALLECQCAGVDLHFDWMASTLMVPPFQHVGWTELPSPLPASGEVLELVQQSARSSAP